MKYTHWALLIYADWSKVTQPNACLAKKNGLIQTQLTIREYYCLTNLSKKTVNIKFPMPRLGHWLVDKPLVDRLEVERRKPLLKLLTSFQITRWMCTCCTEHAQTTTGQRLYGYPIKILSSASDSVSLSYLLWCDFPHSMPQEKTMYITKLYKI